MWDFDCPTVDKEWSSARNPLFQTSVFRSVGRFLRSGVLSL